MLSGSFSGRSGTGFHRRVEPENVITTRGLLRRSEQVEEMVAPYLGDDPVFGRMNGIVLEDFFDAALLASARENAAQKKQGLTLVMGTGAALVCPNPDILVYADLARWEIQRRQRRGEDRESRRRQSAGERIAEI